MMLGCFGAPPGLKLHPTQSSFLTREVVIKDRGSILVIGDTHIPFELPNYLDFCLEIKDRVKCKQVVHIGDLVDLHACSYHEHCPDGYSPADEMREADKHLQRWFKAFPQGVRVCRGNHDSIISRKGRTHGLPTRVFKPFREMWNLPDNWIDAFEHEISGVRFLHGTQYSGENAHMKAAYDSRMNTVIGHLHSYLSGGYTANSKDKIWGMQVGCGVDRNSYAMDYGKDFKRKPIIGCGVVTDNGRYWQTFPMEL
jgi:predicted phosphodiesterase